jgi:lipopolysaccharide/colanic/teichoic acid biosynthesis glycosyltransferase
MRGARRKRAFDVAVSSAGLAALSPVLGIVAVIVKLDSRGPVFFSQERVGKDGQPFRIIKFRTMVVDAERLGPNVSGTHDRRLTRSGSFLRHTFLDEAPQLVNVLKGEMSLVGPRPETPEYVALLTDEERRILSVRPGMTGPSTLEFSAGEADILAAQEDPDRYYRDHLVHERARSDLRYLEVASLREDGRILAGTGALVLRGLGLLRAKPESSPALPAA